MSRAFPLAVGLMAMSLGAPPAWAAHGLEVAHYPSFYPHEIEVEVLDAATAATLLERNSLHAYIGGSPAFAGEPPEHLRPVETLASLLVLDVNPRSEALADPELRCAAARDVARALRNGPTGIVAYPYPVTPFHSDYLHHLDRIEAAVTALDADGPPYPELRIRAEARLAEVLVGERRTAAAGDEWDVAVRAVDVEDLVMEAGVHLDGRSAAPWGREGWFQAFRLLAPAVSDENASKRVEDLYLRLTEDWPLDLAERVAIERDLVESLVSGCDRAVVGHSLRREYLNDEVSTGVENVAYDALLGLNAPLFVRTAKLKDFPWNGWLNLGVAGEAGAAWNPVAGFSDPFGRLLWSALGDPALVPVPYSSSWVPNRLNLEMTLASLRVPRDALVPRPGSDRLERVPEDAVASAMATYEILASPFGDGSETTVADLLYPLVFTYRWGARADARDPAYEPRVESALAWLGERLAGVRLVRIDREVKYPAPDMEIVEITPVLEVYLKNTPGDPHQMAALAPPWSTVPWHVFVLMEEAVLRGLAAFSAEEARRRDVPWLDLVRDPAMRSALTEIARDFARRGYRPDAIASHVTPAEARQRWQALLAFAEEREHFLVTNGPYRLAEWTEKAARLEAVREVTYPLGFGSFDRYVEPLRAVVTEMHQEEGRIMASVEVERTAKVGRHREVVREPLTRRTSRGIRGVSVVSRYLLIGPDGALVAADKARWADDEGFVVELPRALDSGEYSLLLGVYLDGNVWTAAPGIFRFGAGGTQ